MLKFLIIMLAVFYLFPKVLRFGLKLFISKQMDKVQRDFQSKTKPETKEGEIKVDINKKSQKSQSIKGGEYIDYEEVKD